MDLYHDMPPIEKEQEETIIQSEFSGELMNESEGIRCPEFSTLIKPSEIEQYVESIPDLTEVERVNLINKLLAI